MTKFPANPTKQVSNYRIPWFLAKRNMALDLTHVYDKCVEPWSGTNLTAVLHVDMKLKATGAVQRLLAYIHCVTTTYLCMTFACNILYISFMT